MCAFAYETAYEPVYALIVRSFEHSSKVVSAIWVMFKGIVTSARSAHWKKTLSLRLVSVLLAGIVIDFMPVAEKAFQPMFLSVLGRVIFVSFLQFQKALLPIVFASSGIAILLSFLMA